MSLTDYLNPHCLETPMPVDYSAKYLRAREQGCMSDAITWRRLEWTSPDHKDIAEAEERRWWAKHKPETPVPEDQNPKAAQAAADGKLPLHLIDTAMTHPASRVLASGAAKYGKRNWRKVPINASTYVGALRRHTDEWADGIDADHDSGEHPLAHIVATCNVVLDAIKYGTLVDDRLDAEARTATTTEWFHSCAVCGDPETCYTFGCAVKATV